MKFGRYLIYKLYVWSLKRKSDNTPVLNVVLTLSFVGFINVFTTYLIILKFMPKVDLFDKLNRWELIIGIALYFVICYFILYSKERWNRYIEEFQNESKNESKKGSFWVLTYLIGSVALFFALLPVLFGS